MKTPTERIRLRTKRYLRVVKCPGCGSMFKQRAVAQMQCRQDCIPEMPLVYKLGFSLFQKFCENHFIPLGWAIDPDRWYDVVVRRDRYVSDLMRADLLRDCEIIMERFKGGLYVVTPTGIQFDGLKKKFCPVKHHLCVGAMLPGDCPRYEKFCALSKYQASKKEPLKPWRLFHEIRGSRVFDDKPRRGRGRHPTQPTPLFGKRNA